MESCELTSFRLMLSLLLTNTHYTACSPPHNTPYIPHILLSPLACTHQLLFIRVLCKEASTHELLHTLHTMQWLCKLSHCLHVEVLHAIARTRVTNPTAYGGMRRSVLLNEELR